MHRNVTDRSSIRRIAPLALALLAAAGIGVAAAQQSAPSTASHPQHRQGLDANHDGAIDRSEAAAHPRMVAMFERLDRNHDGRLGADERPHRGKHHGHCGHRGGLARLDVDGDGRIGRDELAGKSRIAAKFAAMDGNHDGYVVRSEARAYRDQQRPQRQAERARRFEQRFAAADLNHDGKLGKLEVSENMPRLGKAFAWMDDNRDGFLSREELRPRQR